MEKQVLTWLEDNKGKIVTSPRNKISNREIKDFGIIGFSDNKVKIKFVGSIYPAQPLTFSMFDRTMNILRENTNRAVPLGAKLAPPYYDNTIEAAIWTKPYPIGKSPYKSSPHVCDILALVGIVEYVKARNPETGRRVTCVQFIQKTRVEPIENIQKNVETNKKSVSNQEMSKDEILDWAKKYDEDHPWWVQKEKEIGDKFREKSVMTKKDLVQVIEWKFFTLKGRRKRVQGLISKNYDSEIIRLSKEALKLSVDSDSLRVDLLRQILGVGPALASTILTFYDPKQYGIFDIHVWRQLFGKESNNLFTTKNYLKLLEELRRISSNYELEVRTIEKALFKKNLSA